MTISIRALQCSKWPRFQKYNGVEIWIELVLYGVVLEAAHVNEIYMSFEWSCMWIQFETVVGISMWFV